MGKKLVSKTAKVLSETRKSKEKEAIAIAYEHIPRNPEEQAHGSLYAVLELEDKSGHAEEIAEAIIDALHNEYYLDTTREPLASFESALAKINEELAERSSQGQINWLGKLNGVLAVLSGSTIHLTQAGKAEAYLYRADHAMHITEDLAGDSINPLRSFINIASGDLVENDRLALVTPGIFLKLSKNELKRYATEGSPKSAVSTLSQLLSADSAGSLPNSVLIMEMLSPEAFASEPEPEAPTEAWVKEEKKPMEDVGENTIKGAARTFDVLGKAAAGTAALIGTKVIPGFKSGTAKIIDSVKNFRREPGAEKIILESEEKLDHHQTEANFDNDGILDSGEKTDDYKEIRIKESDTKPKRLSLERFDFSFAKNIGAGVGGVFKGNSVGGNRRNLWYIGGAILLIILLTGGLIYNSNIKKAKTAAQNIENQAQAKYDDAQTSLAAGQRSDAVEDLNTAESLANQNKTNKYQKAAALALLTKISEAKNQALGVVKNTAVLVHDFGKVSLNAIYLDGNIIYAVDADGMVESYDTKTKASAAVISNPGLTSKIKFSTYVSARNVVVAYTEDKNLYELNITTKKAVKVTVSGGIADGVALASYGSSNIYLLSPTNNQIYKYVKSGSGYGAKINYLSATSGNDVTGDVAEAIDSSIYVTTPGATIQKFTSGQKEAYTVKGLPQSFSNLNGLLASAEVKGQYLYGGNVIIQIDSSQNFVAQYISETIKAVQGLSVSDSANQIYALSAGKLYSINK